MVHKAVNSVCYRQRAKERIAVDWNREAVAINRVNPLDFNSVDQMHVVGGSPQAIPTEHDLV